MNAARPGPVFRDLSRDECDALLSAHHVARLAFAFRDRVDIEPIHYVHADGAIYFRTAPGSKVRVLAHHPWVAFEVDEVRALFDWRSVVVHGTVYPLDPDGSDVQRQAFEAGLRHLRTLVPSALDPDDPVAHRTLLYQLHIDTVSGRAAQP